MKIDVEILIVDMNCLGIYSVGIATHIKEITIWLNGKTMEN